jgi:stage III sporulation protein AH
MGHKAEPVNQTLDEQTSFQMAVKNNLQKNEAKGVSFFSEYRLERDRVRGRQVEILREISASQTADQKARNSAALKLVAVSDRAEKEMQAETLIKAKGYQDCVVMLEDDTATVIVEQKQLRPEQEIEIAKAVCAVTGWKADKVSVAARENYSS